MQANVISHITQAQDWQLFCIVRLCVLVSSPLTNCVGPYLLPYLYYLASSELPTWLALRQLTWLGYSGSQWLTNGGTFCTNTHTTCCASCSFLEVNLN